MPAPDRVASLPRRRALALAALGGGLTTLSVPPFGWWPLAFVGIALLIRSAEGAGARRRFALGALFGYVLYGVSLWWMTSFSLPGGLIVAGIEAAFTGLGLLIAGRRSCYVCIPLGLVLADALRSLWPVGGLPLGGIDLGQAEGPLARSVAFGGRLLLIGLVAAGASALALAARHRLRAAAIVGVFVVAGGALARVLPDGTHAAGQRRMAAVQGGGPRGYRSSDQGTLRAYEAHVRATTAVKDPVDLILWPEDIVDVPLLTASTQFADLQAIARQHHAALIVGVVEDAGPKRWHNQAVVIGPDGTLGDRFNKVRRVPYGEYFPLRSLIEGLGLATLPPRDAIAGTGPGVVHTSAGTFAIAVSYEAFFDDRARGGVRAGGQLLLIPTNAASYKTSQVPSQQIAAARLRALETGRWVLQSAPTGPSAVIDNRAHRLAGTRLGARAVIERTLTLRSGLTPYAHTNDTPMLLVVWIALAWSWWPMRRRAGRGTATSGSPDPPHETER